MSAAAKRRMMQDRTGVKKSDPPGELSTAWEAKLGPMQHQRAIARRRAKNQKKK